MSPRSKCIMLTLMPVLLLGACGSSPQQRTSRLLNARLQDRMRSDVAAGHASLQPLADGARVTLLGNALFTNDKLALDDQYSDARASMIEALLDPALMQIQVTDSSTLPNAQRNTRVDNVEQYLADYGLGKVIQQAPLSETVAGAVPAGLTVTITVVCPRRNDRSGYDGSVSKPVCE